MLCDSVEWAIMNAEVVEEVTDKSESYHPQLDYDVRRNNCKLYRIVSNDFEYVISYFEYGIDIDEED